MCNNYTSYWTAFSHPGDQTVGYSIYVKNFLFINCAMHTSNATARLDVLTFNRPSSGILHYRMEIL